MKSRHLTAATLIAAAIIGGTGTAAADDYTNLLIDPNVVVDTLAYKAGAPSANPNGLPGATVIYTHRDGRSITDSVWVLADAAAATAAMTQVQDAFKIANAKTEQVAVGTGGQYISGTSADGTQSRGLLSFTHGNAASAIEFTGPANDPAPVDLAVDLGKAQNQLLTDRLGY